MIKITNYFISRVRWHIRKQPYISMAAYLIPNFLYSFRNKKIDNFKLENLNTGKTALCLRFRDESMYLEEWLNYYIAAGVDHFFLYNNFSTDNYKKVLQPFINSKYVTLIDWPYSPASPSAENDCINRTKGNFDWVGFLDADEFVVIKGGELIPEFLNNYNKFPAVALHWYYYGSSGHEDRPKERVIDAYKFRSNKPNRHFKVFVKPNEVTCNRNSHNFYYRMGKCAVNESERKVYGSMDNKPVANKAWINHYFCKSLEDYLQKAERKSSLDKSGIRDNSRKREKALEIMKESNDTKDECAIDYLYMNQNSKQIN